MRKYKLGNTHDFDMMTGFPTVTYEDAATEKI